MIQRKRLLGSILSLTVLLCFKGIAAAQTPLPPDRDYVVVKNGHLSLDGERVRYWAVIGKPYVSAGVRPDDSAEEKRRKVAISRRGTNVLVDRFTDLGFNASRFWGSLPDEESYTIGDGSEADTMDYFIARMKEKGLKIWAAGLNNAGEATPDQVNVVREPETAEAWQKAVSEWNGGKPVGLRNNVARIWDPRLEAIGIRNMERVAKHFNKHTGLRWCDDPVFVAWELSNEEWWIGRMLGGGWQKLPPYFRNELVAQWNDWLRKKYGSDAKLKAAWKELLPGESLEKRTVIFAPMRGATSSAAALNDANPLAADALSSLKQEYKREDFAPARGEDVLAFLVHLHVSHKQREAKAVKSWGKSTRLSPLVYDTGIGYEIQSQYLHQHADAVAHDAYVNGTGPDYQEPDLAAEPTTHRKQLAMINAERISANQGRWVNWLLKPPGIAQGVPWMEHNKIEGKPFFAYETQIQQPARYRADYPLRVAALAAIQDWDFVCWHYFGAADQAGTELRPFDRPMDITTGGHPQGYHYTYDEVQNAMMRAAGIMFREFALKPAPNPTKFIYGRKSLYNPDSMVYAGSYGEIGMDMLQTVYQYGARIQIDPKQEGDKVIGPVVKFEDRKTHNPYTPTDQIVFDWKKGFLEFDAPAGVAWTGLMANYGDTMKFENGVTLKNVTINNPSGIYEPMTDDEKYIAFSLHSLDGKPLKECRKASLSLVSTSYNSGFQMGGEGKRSEAGGLPVLVARVGGTVDAPALNGMRYTLRDWHMKPLGTGTVTNGTLTIPHDKPVFVIEFDR
ncbi:MAG: hypothetical protein OHK0029_14130 [Armatimonadaceae bacterium]